MKMTQPSNSCRKPSACAVPNRSTSTPITPMRKLFIRMVMGTVDATTIRRIHIGKRIRLTTMMPSASSGNR